MQVSFFKGDIVTSERIPEKQLRVVGFTMTHLRLQDTYTGNAYQAKRHECTKVKSASQIK